MRLKKSLILLLIFQHVAHETFFFRCKSLLSEFNELPDRMTRKRKTQRLTRNTKNTGKIVKSNSSDSSESDRENDDEVSDKIYYVSK